MIPLKRLAMLRKVTPNPPDWSAAFRRIAPIEVDLGCGRGHYAQERACNAPEINIVALDYKRKWIQHLKNQAKIQDIQNLVAIRCDVSEDLPILFAPKSIQGFTIFHPDPWWKKRHRKRRLVNKHFVKLLSNLLVPQGWIYLQTDVDDLAAEIQACFESQKSFRALDPVKHQTQQLKNTRSHREEKCNQLGVPVRRLAYTLTHEE